MDRRLLKQIVRGYPELGGDPGGEPLSALLADAVEIDAPAGQVLFEMGDRSLCLPLLLEGALRVVRPAHDGSELFLYRLHVGELCAMTALALLVGGTSRVRVVSETRLRAIGLDGGAFGRALERCARFRIRVLTTVAGSVDALLQRFEEAAKLDVAARVARRLLEEAPVVRCTHQELADGLGCSREVVSRALEEFQRSGWVALQRRRIEVRDRPGLRHFVDS